MGVIMFSLMSARWPCAGIRISFFPQHGESQPLNSETRTLVKQRIHTGKGDAAIGTDSHLDFPRAVSGGVGVEPGGNLLE
jgi:hypothetical protein